MASIRFETGECAPVNKPYYVGVGTTRTLNGWLYTVKEGISDTITSTALSVSILQGSNISYKYWISGDAGTYTQTNSGVSISYPGPSSVIGFEYSSTTAQQIKLHFNIAIYNISEKLAEASTDIYLYIIDYAFHANFYGNGGYSSLDDEGNEIPYIKTINATVSQVGELITKPTQNPIRIGYDFDGWNTQTNGTTDVSSSLAWDANYDLYAIWRSNSKYQVTIRRLGQGTITNISPATVFESGSCYYCEVSINSTVSFTVTPATGYYLNNVSNGTAQSYVYAPNSTTVTSVRITGTTLIKVGLTAITCDVTLDRQSGSNGTASVSVTYGSTTMSNIGIPSRTSYTFKGYYTGTDGTGTQYINASGVWQVSNTTFGNNTTYTLYAYWVGNYYTLTWNADGGTLSGMSPTSGSVEYNTALTWPTSKTKTGYTFKNYTVTGGTTSTTTMPANNLTVKANWTANTGIINIRSKIFDNAGTTELTYDADTNDETHTSINVSISSTGGTTDTVVTLTAPAKTGATFWKWVDNNSNQLSTDSTYSLWAPSFPTNGASITAVPIAIYKRNKYTVSLTAKFINGSTDKWITHSLDTNDATHSMYTNAITIGRAGITGEHGCQVPLNSETINSISTNTNTECWTLIGSHITLPTTVSLATVTKYSTIESITSNTLVYTIYRRNIYSLGINKAYLTNYNVNTVLYSGAASNDNINTSSIAPSGPWSNYAEYGCSCTTTFESTTGFTPYGYTYKSYSEGSTISSSDVNIVNNSNFRQNYNFINTSLKENKIIYILLQRNIYTITVSPRFYNYAYDTKLGSTGNDASNSTYTGATGGTVTQTIEYNNTIQLTRWTPDNTNAFAWKKWSVSTEGVTVSSHVSNVEVIYNVTKDISINADFYRKRYTITWTGAGGSFASTSSYCEYGLTNTCTWTPITGYYVTGVTNGTAASTGSVTISTSHASAKAQTITSSAVTADMTVTVASSNLYRITFNFNNATLYDAMAARSGYTSTLTTNIAWDNAALRRITPDTGYYVYSVNNGSAANTSTNNVGSSADSEGRTARNLIKSDKPSDHSGAFAVTIYTNNIYQITWETGSINYGSWANSSTTVTYNNSSRNSFNPITGYYVTSCTNTLNNTGYSKTTKSATSNIATNAARKAQIVTSIVITQPTTVTIQASNIYQVTWAGSNGSYSEYTDSDRNGTITTNYTVYDVSYNKQAKNYWTPSTGYYVYSVTNGAPTSASRNNIGSATDHASRAKQVITSQVITAPITVTVNSNNVYTVKWTGGTGSWNSGITTVTYNNSGTNTFTPTEGYYVTSCTNTLNDAGYSKTTNTNTENISTHAARNAQTVTSIVITQPTTVTISTSNIYRIWFTGSGGSFGDSYKDITYGNTATSTWTPTTGYYVTGVSNCAGSTATSDNANPDCTARAAQDITSYAIANSGANTIDHPFTVTISSDNLYHIVCKRTINEAYKSRSVADYGYDYYDTQRKSYAILYDDYIRYGQNSAVTTLTIDDGYRWEAAGVYGYDDTISNHKTIYNKNTILNSFYQDASCSTSICLFSENKTGVNGYKTAVTQNGIETKHCGLKTIWARKTVYFRATAVTGPMMCWVQNIDLYVITVAKPTGVSMSDYWGNANIKQTSVKWNTPVAFNVTPDTGYYITSITNGVCRYTTSKTDTDNNQNHGARKAQYVYFMCGDTNKLAGILTVPAYTQSTYSPAEYAVNVSNTYRVWFESLNADSSDGTLSRTYQDITYGNTATSTWTPANGYFVYDVEEGSHPNPTVISTATNTQHSDNVGTFVGQNAAVTMNDGLVAKTITSYTLKNSGTNTNDCPFTVIIDTSNWYTVYWRTSATDTGVFAVANTAVQYNDTGYNNFTPNTGYYTKSKTSNVNIYSNSARTTALVLGTVTNAVDGHVSRVQQWLTSGTITGITTITLTTSNVYRISLIGSGTWEISGKATLNTAYIDQSWDNRITAKFTPNTGRYMTSVTYGSSSAIAGSTTNAITSHSSRAEQTITSDYLGLASDGRHPGPFTVTVSTNNQYRVTCTITDNTGDLSKYSSGPNITFVNNYYKAYETIDYNASAYYNVAGHAGYYIGSTTNGSFSDYVNNNSTNTGTSSALLTSAAIKEPTNITVTLSHKSWYSFIFVGDDKNNGLTGVTFENLVLKKADNTTYNVSAVEFNATSYPGWYYIVMTTLDKDDTTAYTLSGKCYKAGYADYLEYTITKDILTSFSISDNGNPDISSVYNKLEFSKTIGDDWIKSLNTSVVPTNQILSKYVSLKLYKINKYYRWLKIVTASEDTSGNTTYTAFGSSSITVRIKDGSPNQHKMYVVNNGSTDVAAIDAYVNFIYSSNGYYYLAWYGCSSTGEDGTDTTNPGNNHRIHINASNYSIYKYDTEDNVTKNNVVIPKTSTSSNPINTSQYTTIVLWELKDYYTWVKVTDESDDLEGCVVTDIQKKKPIVLTIKDDDSDKSLTYGSEVTKDITMIGVSGGWYYNCITHITQPLAKTGIIQDSNGTKYAYGTRATNYISVSKSGWATATSSIQNTTGYITSDFATTNGTTLSTSTSTKASSYRSLKMYQLYTWYVVMQVKNNTISKDNNDLRKGSSFNNSSTEVITGVTVNVSSTETLRLGSTVDSQSSTNSLMTEYKDGFYHNTFCMGSAGPNYTNWTFRTYKDGYQPYNGNQDGFKEGVATTMVCSRTNTPALSTNNNTLNTSSTNANTIIYMSKIHTYIVRLNVADLSTDVSFSNADTLTLSTTGTSAGDRYGTYAGYENGNTGITTLGGSDDTTSVTMVRATSANDPYYTNTNEYYIATFNAGPIYYAASNNDLGVKFTLNISMEYFHYTDEEYGQYPKSISKTFRWFVKSESSEIIKETINTTDVSNPGVKSSTYNNLMLHLNYYRLYEWCIPIAPYDPVLNEYIRNNVPDTNYPLSKLIVSEASNSGATIYTFGYSFSNLTKDVKPTEVTSINMALHIPILKGTEYRYNAKFVMTGKGAENVNLTFTALKTGWATNNNAWPINGRTTEYSGRKTWNTILYNDIDETSDEIVNKINHFTDLYKLLLYYKNVVIRDDNNTTVYKCTTKHVTAPTDGTNYLIDTLGYFNTAAANTTAVTDMDLINSAFQGQYYLTFIAISTLKTTTKMNEVEEYGFTFEFGKAGYTNCPTGQASLVVTREASKYKYVEKSTGKTYDSKPTNDYWTNSNGGYTVGSEGAITWLYGLYRLHTWYANVYLEEFGADYLNDNTSTTPITNASVYLYPDNVSVPNLLTTGNTIITTVGKKLNNSLDIISLTGQRTTYLSGYANDHLSVPDGSGYYYNTFVMGSYGSNLTDNWKTYANYGNQYCANRYDTTTSNSNILTTIYISDNSYSQNNSATLVLYKLYTWYIIMDTTLVGNSASIDNNLKANDVNITIDGSAISHIDDVADGVYYKTFTMAAGGHEYCKTDADATNRKVINISISYPHYTGKPTTIISGDTYDIVYNKYCSMTFPTLTKTEGTTDSDYKQTGSLYYIYPIYAYIKVIGHSWKLTNTYTATYDTNTAPTLYNESIPIQYDGTNIDTVSTSHYLLGVNQAINGTAKDWNGCITIKYPLACKDINNINVAANTNTDKPILVCTDYSYESHNDGNIAMNYVSEGLYSLHICNCNSANVPTISDCTSYKAKISRARYSDINYVAGISGSSKQQRYIYNNLTIVSDLSTYGDITVTKLTTSLTNNINDNTIHLGTVLYNCKYPFMDVSDSSNKQPIDFVKLFTSENLINIYDNTTGLRIQSNTNKVNELMASVYDNNITIRQKTNGKNEYITSIYNFENMATNSAATAELLYKDKTTPLVKKTDTQYVIDSVGTHMLLGATIGKCCYYNSSWHSGVLIACQNTADISSTSWTAENTLNIKDVNLPFIKLYKKYTSNKYLTWYSPVNYIYSTARQCTNNLYMMNTNDGYRLEYDNATADDITSKSSYYIEFERNPNITEVYIGKRNVYKAFLTDNKVTRPIREIWMGKKQVYYSEE